MLWVEALLETQTRWQVFLEALTEDVQVVLEEVLPEALEYQAPALLLEEPAETWRRELAVNCRMLGEAARREVLHSLALLGLATTVARAKVQAQVSEEASTEAASVVPPVEEQDQDLTKSRAQEMALRFPEVG